MVESGLHMVESDLHTVESRLHMVVVVQVHTDHHLHVAYIHTTSSTEALAKIQALVEVRIRVVEVHTVVHLLRTEVPFHTVWQG